MFENTFGVHKKYISYSENLVIIPEIAFVIIIVLEHVCRGAGWREGANGAVTVETFYR